MLSFVEQRQLRRRRIDRSLGLSAKQSLAQRRNLFFQKADSGLHFRKHLLEQFGVVRKADESGYARGRNHPIAS